MKKAFLLLFLILDFQEVRAQAALAPERGTFKELGFITGYNYNIKDADSRKYHLIELGIISSTYSSYHHPVNASYYYANELGLNTKRFVWGPKVGAYVGYGMFVAGTEAIYYTNFRAGTFRVVPYFGLGFYQFKLTLNPHITICNKDFPLNAGNINITIRPFVITSRKVN